ncbi:MAG: FAD-binding oxidoreductase [Rhizobiales bacterium]|nr:FAD-binding oxidoreductase [Hyphomicrobiales bacterium]
MPSTTHPDAFHFEWPVDSYWEASAPPLEAAMPLLSGNAQCDVAIIGGGYTGLSAALELASSGMDVRILEAAEPGWGASGRNGGFACIGSHKRSYASMISIYGIDGTRAFYRAMKESVGLVHDLCTEHQIDAKIAGKGEITLAHLPNRLEEFRAEQKFLRETFGDETELLTPAELKLYGLWGPEFHGGLLGRTGFGIHPLRYVRGLATAAAKAGVTIHSRSRLMRWEESSNGHVLSTANGTLRAKRVLVATNGYTPEDISNRHAGRLMPALSNIIVTRPLSDAELQAQCWTSHVMAYDSRNLLHYFRLLPDKRFLFGGRGGTDASNAGAGPMRQKLTATFHRLFPAWSNAEITHFWRGFVCLAYDLVPYIGPLDEKKTVWTALAYHGNGVAMGTWSGRAVAQLMTDRKKAADMPNVITRRLANFPLPAFRPHYLKGAYLWFGWKDSH